MARTGIERWRKNSTPAQLTHVRLVGSQRASKASWASSGFRVSSRMSTPNSESLTTLGVLTEFPARSKLPIEELTTLAESTEPPARSGRWTPPSLIFPLPTEFGPRSVLFTSPLTMSSENTVLDPSRAQALPPERTRKSAISPAHCWRTSARILVHNMEHLPRVPSSPEGSPAPL